MASELRCPRCNQPNDTSARACSNCGAELVRRCARCGTWRPWNVAVCPGCQSTGDDAVPFASLFQKTRTGALRGRYQLLEPMVSGPVSTVYRALDVRDPDRLYAIKEISTVALFRAEERRAAENAVERTVARWSTIRHPGIARVIDSFSEGDRHYVVSEYVYGWGLDSVLLDPSLRAGIELVRNWGAQLCDVLTYLHGQSTPLYVPFLSPAHLIASPEGAVRLIGHGLSYQIQPDAHGPYGSLPGYGAPELAQRTPDAQTDIFSLGRILYALLVDRALEKGVPRGLSLQKAVPGIGADLVRVVARAATSRREQRYVTAADLRAGLVAEDAAELAPVTDWFHTAQTGISADSARGRTTAPVGPSMADHGFSRDARFGPRELPSAAEEKRAAAPSGARMSVYPTRLQLKDLPTGEPKRVVLTVRNAGVDDLEFHVLPQVPWLKAPSREVRLPSAKQARVVVTVDAAAIPGDRASDTRALLLESNVGRQWVPATVEFRTAPVLAVAPVVIDFGELTGDGQATATLTLSNAGRQVLSGQVLSRVAWLQVQPAEVRIAAGARAEVSVRLIRERLPHGPQRISEALVVDTNGGQATISAAAWAPEPRLELAESVLDFGTIATNSVVHLDLAIVNAGDGTLHGTARSLVPWLRADAEQWVCPAGQRCLVRLTADTAGLEDGPMRIPQALRLQSDGGSATLAARLQISAPRLALEPSAFDLGIVRLGETAEGHIVIRNTGSAPLDALIVSALPWLVPAVESVTCAPGEACRVGVRAETGQLASGGRLEIPAAIRVSAGFDVQAVAVSIVVLQPLLLVEPGFVDFGYLDPATPGIQELIMTNAGTGDLAWYAQTDAEWVELQPASGRCAEGSQARLTLTAYALAMEAGAQQASATLAITSDAGRIKVPLRVALAAPRLEVDRTFVDLGTSVNREAVTASVRIFNRGLGLLRGTAISDRLWLVAERTSLECDTGHSLELVIRADMAEFPEELSEDRGVIALDTNGGTVEIDVRLQFARSASVREPEAVMLKAAESGAQGRLVIHNDGMATAHVDIGSPDSRLLVSRDRVEVKPGKSVRVSVTWQDAMLPRASEAHLTVTSEDQTWQVEVIS